MAVPRRAFALVLVLVAVGATFALAMQGLVAWRSATAEAGVLRRDAALMRDAAGAATIALAALTAGADTRTDVARSSAAARASTTPTLDDAELPDMPQEMKEFLLGLMNRDRNPDDPASSTAGAGGLAISRHGGAYTALSRRGVPTAPIETRVADRTFRVTVADAGGLLNINTASEQQIARYFTARGVSERDSTTIAQHILDWRDEDDIPRPFGAERETYLRHGVVIRNGPFASIEELRFLPAIPPELLAVVRDELTLVGDGTINARTASRALLLSVDSMTTEAADRILALRATGGLDERSLREALGVLAADADRSLRLTPTSALRLRIEPAGGGPVFVADAFIDDTRGVQILNLSRTE